MEIFVVEPTTMSKVDVFDVFSSFIWTERYTGWGEFEALVPYNEDFKRRFSVGYYLQHVESDKTMLIETCRDFNKNGRYFKITGRSVECILDNRITKETWTWTGTPGEIACLLFRDNFMTYDPVRSYSVNDMIPNSHYMIRDSVGPTISYKPKLGSLYDAINELSAFNNTGYSVIFERRDNLPRMTFVSYTGRQRKNVVFNEQLGTLYDTEVIRSTSQYRTVALVKKEDGYVKQVLRDQFFKPNNNVKIPPWFSRRLTIVDGSDIKKADYPSNVYEDLLTSRGKLHLEENSYLNYLTGVTPTKNIFSYGFNKDYYLGDVVTLTNGVEVSTSMVTEYIWTIDETGTQSYPTLSEMKV